MDLGVSPEQLASVRNFLDHPPRDGSTEEIEPPPGMVERDAMALVQVVLDDPRDRRRLAMRLLLRHRNPASLNVVWHALLEHRDGFVRSATAARLAVMGNPEDLQVILDLLARYPRAHSLVIPHLARSRDRRIVPLLAEALNGTDYLASQNAVLALRAVGAIRDQDGGTGYIAPDTDLANARRWWTEHGPQEFAAEISAWEARKRSLPPLPPLED